MRPRPRPHPQAHPRSAQSRAPAATPGLAAAAIAVALLLSGCAGAGIGAEPGAAVAPGVDATAPGAPVTPATSAASPPALSDPAAGAAGALQNPQLADPSAAPATDATPVRVRIPAIGVDSGLESLTRDDTGWIQPPADFGSAGWYRDGVVPGQLGPAVIAGHIDSAVGPAVFSGLAALKLGDTADIELSDGSTVTFRVDRSIQVPKSGFPTDEVYGPTPDAQLRLVTCGGAFDDASGHYLDNVVVFATQVTG